MSTYRLLAVALLFLGSGVLRADGPATNEANRQIEAVRAIRLALEDLPPGEDAEQIKATIERLRKRLTDDLKGRIKQAEADVETARDRAAWAARMVKAGYMTPGQAQPARDKVEDAEHALRTLQERQKLITDDAIKAALEKNQKRRIEDIKDRIKLVEADLEMWKDRSAWSERMVKKGYFTPTQARGDRTRVEQAEQTLRDLRDQLKLLTDDPKKGTPATPREK